MEAPKCDKDGIHIDDEMSGAGPTAMCFELSTLPVACCMRASVAGCIIWKLTPFVKSTLSLCKDNELLGRVVEALKEFGAASFKGACVRMHVALEGLLKSEPGELGAGRSSVAKSLLLFGFKSLSWKPANN